MAVALLGPAKQPHGQRMGAEGRTGAAAQAQGDCSRRALCHSRDQTCPRRSPPRGCAIAPWALWLGARLQKKRRERTKHPPCPAGANGCLSPWELLPCADPSEMTPHLREQEAASAAWHGAAGRAAHARISTASSCRRHGRGLHPSRSTLEEHPAAGRTLVCCRKLSSSTSASFLLSIWRWEEHGILPPGSPPASGGTSPGPSAPQSSSANQTKFTWEPQPRVQGGDRRYLCSHVTGIPAKRGTQLEGL